MHSEKIRKIDIQGNVFFTEKQLEAILQCREKKEFDRLKFKEDRGRIVSFYNGQGFLDMALTKYEFKRDSEGITIYIGIDEQFRTVINEIKVFGNSIYSNEQILKMLSLEKNAPLNMAYLSSKELVIIDAYASKGYIYANADFELFDKENRYRKILYVSIDEGRKAYVGEINYDSLPARTVNVAKHVMTIKTGDLYIPGNVYSAQQELYNTGLFKWVEFRTEGIDSRQDTLKIVFRGEEKKNKWVSGGLLYQFPDRGKLILGWGNDNLFSNGEMLSLKASGTMNLATDTWLEGEFSYKVPYLFKALSYLFQLNVYREKNDAFQNLQFTVTMGLGREIFKHTVSNNYKYKISIIDTSADSIPVRFQNANTNSTDITVFRDTRDNPFFPTSGMFYSFKYELAGGILQGYNNYNKYLGEIASYRTYMDRVTLAGRLRSGVIMPFGDSESRGITIDEQFKMGGYSSVRGVENDSLGPLNEIGTHSGNMLVNANAEMRILIYKIVGLTYFFDTGAMYSDTEIPSIGDFTLCGGLGVFVNTIIGPVRFDVAKPLNESGPMQFYLNLGNSF